MLERCAQRRKLVIGLLGKTFHHHFGCRVPLRPNKMNRRFLRLQPFLEAKTSLVSVPTANWMVRVVGTSLNLSPPYRGFLTRPRGGFRPSTSSLPPKPHFIKNTRQYVTSASSPRFPGAPTSVLTANYRDALSQPPSESIPTYRAVDDDGTILDKEADALLSDEALSRIWKNMLIMREFDTVMHKLQRQGRFSFFMTQFGEEASLFGLGESLRRGDIVFGQYREQALLFHLGKSLSEIMSSYFATRNDNMRGRQMPQT